MADHPRRSAAPRRVVLRGVRAAWPAGCPSCHQAVPGRLRLRSRSVGGAVPSLPRPGGRAVGEGAPGGQATGKRPLCVRHADHHTSLVGSLRCGCSKLDGQPSQVKRTPIGRWQRPAPPLSLRPPSRSRAPDNRVRAMAQHRDGAVGAVNLSVRKSSAGIRASGAGSRSRPSMSSLYVTSTTTTGWI